MGLTVQAFSPEEELTIFEVRHSSLLKLSLIVIEGGLRLKEGVLFPYKTRFNFNSKTILEFDKN